LFRPGVVHEGTAQGKWETIAGIKCYVATPTVDYPKDAVILYMPDIFGVQFINSQVRGKSDGGAEL
jgi:hypothetical protein